MPVQSWGGVGSGAGTQGLPYGQGFNQITGQPFPAFASQAAAISAPAAPQMSSQQQVAYNGGLTQADQEEINRIRGPFTGGGQQGWQYQEAIQRVYDRAAARGRTPVSVPSAQAISFAPGGYTGSTGGATAFAPANGSNGLTAARSAVPSSYADILQGYSDMEASLAGLGDSQLADIARRYGGYEGKTVQNAISRGLAPQYAPVGTFEAGRAGTPLASMLRGLRYDQEAANRAAMEGINQQRLGIQQQRLSAAERIQGAQASQSNQAAQLELERQRLAQQNAQFQASLNQARYPSGGGSSGGGGGGGVRQGSSGLPNLGQTGIVNYGQLDRYGYAAAPTGSFGNYSAGGYTSYGGDPSQVISFSNPSWSDPYTSPADAGFGGYGDIAQFGGYGNFGDWGTGFDFGG